MNKDNISLSVPATIYDFGEIESLTKNKYVTHSKLKLFYVGTTRDNRVFTKEFSDQLLQTLPGTPVVAYYDEEDQDFIGHWWVQYVFGYVPENATIEYVEEGVNTWAITDVLLFTGREDNIGEVAKKIIGKQHSLELDPNTVEYILEKKEGEDFPQITFTKADFIGLSVLGDWDSPAFPGSSFFTEDAELETFIKSFNEFKTQVEQYKFGGKEMDKDKDLSTLEKTEVEEIEAVETTEEEIFEKEQLDVVGMETEEVIEEPEVEVDTETTEPEITEEVEEETEAEEEDFEASVETENEDSSEVETAEILEGMEDVGKETETEYKEEEEESEEAFDSNSAALNKAEREELNAYRRKAKYELIDSYEELDEKVKDEFKAKHEEFTVDQLDKELAFALVKSMRQNKTKDFKVFSMEIKKADEGSVEGLIEKYKDKN